MLIRLAWRNIWRNKKRSVITLTSIVVAVFLSVFMRSMQLGMYESMIDDVIGSYAGYIQIHSNGYWEERTIDNGLEFTQTMLDSLEQLPGVKSILPRVENFGLLSKGELTKVITINGIDLEKERTILNLEEKMVEGHLFSHPKEVIVGKSIATFFKLRVKDTIVFMGQGYHGVMAADKLIVSGIIDLKNPALNRTMVIQSVADAQVLFSAPHIATSLVVDKEENVDLEHLQKLISRQLDSNSYEIMNWKELFPELEQTIVADSVGGLLMVMILYMILVFGIFGTVLMMTQERQYEFGVLVAIGMQKLKLISMVVIETVFLSLLGVILGIIAVYPFLIWKHFEPMQLPGDSAQMMEDYGFSPDIPFYIHVDLPIAHAAIIFFIALFVAIYPIFTINKLNPVKAMRI